MAVPVSLDDMHPYAALLLCLCFVAALFVLDRSWRSRMSVGEWIALFWVLIIGSRPVTSWFDASQINSLEAIVEGSPLDRAIFLLLIIAGLMVLFARRFDWLRFAAANKWIILYFAYLGLSTLWSDYTSIALRRWIKDLGNFVIVLLVLSEANPVAAIKAVLTRTSYVLVPLSVVLVKYFPDISRSYDLWTGRVFFSGVGTNKNMLGMTLTALALGHLWSLVSLMREQSGRHKKVAIAVHVTLLLFIAWLLALADCATALACIVVGGMILLTMRFRGVRKHIVLLMTLATIGGLLFAIPDVRVFIMEPVVGMLGRDISLTDRDDLWRVLLEQDVNPIIGVGSYSFWMGARIERPLPGLDGWANSAHNAYLEMYLNGGLVGLALYLAILASSTIKAARNIGRGVSDNAENFRLAFLVVAVLYGVTEAIVRLNLIWFTLLMVVVRADLPRLGNPLKARNAWHESQSFHIAHRPKRLLPPGKA